MNRDGVAGGKGNIAISRVSATTATVTGKAITSATTIPDTFDSVVAAIPVSRDRP
jgi:hypothetical protein